jgi:type I restriction enzyme S subunit
LNWNALFYPKLDPERSPKETLIPVNEPVTLGNWMGIWAVVSETSSNDNENDSLPSGWAQATISDLIGKSGIFIDGDWVESKDQDPQGDIRLIQLADIGDGTFRNKSNRFLTSSKAAELNCTYLTENDVLIARMPDPLGRACIFPRINQRCVTVVDVCVVRAGTSDIDHHWLMYTINSPQFRIKIGSLQSGSTRKRISRGNLSTLVLPIPPLPEQHRIVAKIEELFTQLDAGGASLKTAQAQLKRYRQAVLKAAFEGRLTQEWREEHKGEIESVDALLERIKEARKKSAFNNNYTIPSFFTDVQSLPDTWRWIRLDNIAFIKGGITKDSKRIVENGREIPYLRVANVQDGYLDLYEMKTIVADEVEIKNLSLKFGDILFTEGGDRDKLGRGWIWQEEIPDCIYQNHIFRARLYLDEISSKYVSWFGNTHSQKYFMKKGKQTTNLASISLTQLRAFPVAFPPMEEQKIIVDAIERHFSQIDHLENTLTTSLHQAESLRQSILKCAFEGKLVPQDPNDEPASVLLERIRAEKARRASEGKKGKAHQPPSPKKKVRHAK